jgi:uncharacterized repeat protein (TIGR03803 family)
MKLRHHSRRVGFLSPALSHTANRILSESNMPTPMPDLLKAICHASLRLAVACTLLVACSAAPVLAQSYQDLYDFTCGCVPYGRLTQGKNGALYGTTMFGGTNNDGTIFMVNPDGTGYTIVWNFDGATTGESPTGGLTLSSFDGNFYGTTTNGGANGNGTLFQFNPVTLVATPVHHFTSTEFRPAAPPVESRYQNLYGMTLTDPGTAYELIIKTLTFQVLPNTVPNQPSSGPLLLASDGNFYGTTVASGPNQEGTVFTMTDAGAIKTIYKFTDGDSGFAPNSPLAQGKGLYAAYLYGTAYSGGGTGGELETGTIFQLTLPPPIPSTEATLYTFSTAGGYNPDAGLLTASDGNLYGTTRYGGADNVGTLFEISPAGTFISWDDFTGVGGLVSGADPNTTLMEHTNGLLYGLTPAGGANADGVLYSFTPPSPVIHISLCCNWWVILDQPVTIIGQNLSQVIGVSFGSVQTKFRLGSDTYLTAQVPSAAIDAPISVTLATGLQIESQQSARILPKVVNLDPSSGPVGAQVSIVGGGFAGTKKITFGGVPTTNFTVISPSLIQATVPSGAVTGKVGVTTPNGSATSKSAFTVN